MMYKCKVFYALTSLDRQVEKDPFDGHFNNFPNTYFLVKMNMNKKKRGNESNDQLRKM